jgi:hypothetical protein
MGRRSMSRGAEIARVDSEHLVSVGDVMSLDDVAREAVARHRFRLTRDGECHY